MMAILGNWVMEQVLGPLKDQRVTLGVVIALVVVFGYVGFLWADNEHGDLLTRAESAAETRLLKEQIDENGRTAQQALSLLQNQNKLLQEHVEDFAITMASQAVKDAKSEIRVAESNPNITERELKFLEEELEHAEQYKECLVRRGSNCKHIRDSNG